MSKRDLNWGAQAVRESETCGGSSTISGCQRFKIPKSEQEVAVRSHFLKVDFVLKSPCPMNAELPMGGSNKQALSSPCQ